MLVFGMVVLMVVGVVIYDVFVIKFVKIIIELSLSCKRVLILILIVLRILGVIRVKSVKC